MTAKEAKTLAKSSFFRFWETDLDFDTILDLIIARSKGGSFDLLFRFTTASKRKDINKKLTALKYVTLPEKREGSFNLYVNWELDISE